MNRGLVLGGRGGGLLVEFVGEVGVEAFYEMAVGVHGDDDGTVSESGLDGFGVGFLGDEEGGVGVAGARSLSRGPQTDKRHYGRDTLDGTCRLVDRNRSYAYQAFQDGWLRAGIVISSGVGDHHEVDGLAR